jgi:hypothetical protein
MENLNNVIRFKIGNYKYIHSYLAYSYIENTNYISDGEITEWIKVQYEIKNIWRIVKGVKILAGEIH